MVLIAGESKPLTRQQHRAAALVGRGMEFREVAREVGVVPETISRWSRREDFQKIAEKARKELLSDEPNAVATLEAALGATRKDGSPDWAIRVQAARTLIGRRGVGGGEPEKAVRETRIFLHPEEGNADGKSP